MKAILSFFFLLFLFTAYTQQVKIVLVGDLSTDIEGTEVEAIGNPDDLLVYKDMRIINTSQENLTIQFRRKRIHPSSALDQICDEQLCHNANDEEFFTTPIEISLNAGDTTIFKPQIVPDGEALCAIHEYSVVSPFNQAYGSVTLKFRTGDQNCFLSTAELKTPSFSFYPNPAKDFITVSTGNEGGHQMIITDALGKVVKKHFIQSETEKVNISGIKNGVYLVQVIDDNGNRSVTKRIVIKK
jgi:hypothetical protein